jgi:hypothetical protein
MMTGPSPSCSALVRNGEMLCVQVRGTRERSFALRFRQDASDGLSATASPTTTRSSRPCSRETQPATTFKAKKKEPKAGAGTAWTTLAEHIYRDEHGVPCSVTSAGQQRPEYPQYHREASGGRRGAEGPKIRTGC